MTELPRLEWAHKSANPYNPASYKKITNFDRWEHRRTKPRGGLWTSPTTSTGSCWIDWCYDANWGTAYYDTCTPITSTPTANITTIDSLADLTTLLGTFPGPDGDDTNLDYVKLSTVYDAVWLTSRGRVATCDLNKEPNLFGWDIETVLWLNPDAYTPGTPTEVPARDYPPGECRTWLL